MKDTNLLSELRLDPAQRDGGGSGRRWLWYVIAALLLAAMVIGAVLALRTQAVEVETATAQTAGTVAGGVAVLDATGYVTARREATVSSKVTGKLAEVLIEEGVLVKEGQVLARLEDADEQAQLHLAQAQVGAVKAQLGQLQAQSQQAQRNLKRQQELNARHLTTTQALEDARTAVQSLNAQLQAQQMQVGVADAQWRVAQINLDNTIIRSPFAGVIVAKAAQPGEIVSPMSAGGGYTRTGIGTIVDMDSLEIEVDVNEAYINRVKPQQNVVAVLDAYPDWKIPAEVIAIIPTADRSKATVRVRIALKVKDPRIVPDMGIRVSFYESSPNNPQQALQGVLVPASAIVQRDGQTVVFVIKGDAAQRHVVTAGAGYGDLRLIETGLENGARVVRAPPANLQDGMRIKQKAAN